MLELAREGSIGGDDLVMRPGSEEWVRADQVPAFAASGAPAAAAPAEEPPAPPASAEPPPAPVARRSRALVIAAALVLAIAGVAVGAPLAFDTGPGTGGVTDSVVATSTVPVSTTGLALPSEGILFSRMKDGHQHIYVMAADGSDPQPVTDSELGDTHPSASPDGGRIVFVREDKGLMLLDAGGEKQLTEDAAYQPSSPTWSSDGERVFYSRLDSASEGASRYIHSMKADGTDDRKVSPAFSGSVGSDDDPALSSDGETLVFVTTRRPGPAVPGWAHGQGLRFDLFNGGVPDDFVLTVDGDTIAGSATYPYEGGTMNNELMLRRTK